MSDWKLTVRHGSDVERTPFDDLAAAIAAARERAEQIRGEGPLQGVSMLRDFEPEQRVHARVEISGRGLLRPPTAGVDLMGDGRLVPFRGGIRRQELKPRRGGDAFDALERELRR